MKRIVAGLLTALLVLLAGCGAVEPAPSVTPPVSEPATVPTPVPTTEQATAAFSIPSGLPAVELDLSSLSKTMMYSQVYDMIYNPDAYLGKTVRILGPVNCAVDEETGREHYACIIEDATACCMQGIEFELADPDVSVPPNGETVLVSGTFDTYMDGPYLYCVLRRAVLES